MSDKEWDRFFELMDKITELPMSVDEKAALCVREAKDRGDRESMALEEFTAWMFDFDVD